MIFKNANLVIVQTVSVLQCILNDCIIIVFDRVVGGFINTMKKTLLFKF